MTNLAEVSKLEQLEFINSFDHVLCDLDGVVWLQYKPFPGAAKCLNFLKKLGKKVHYVSNNSTIPVEMVKEKLRETELDTDLEDIIIPISAIISYLKKINFNKELYVIGLTSVKETLKKEGFLLAADGPQQIEESYASLLSNIDDNENVGGVLVDLDLNVNFIKLQKAVTYLQREDCIFITGTSDAKLPLLRGKHKLVIGPHYFMKAVIDISGRQPYQIAKPHENYNEFVLERFEITDPKRVLFIGDSVNEDMTFATKCGYQKLLVLSGITKEEHLSDWKYPEEYKPQYYVGSLTDLNEIINQCFS